MSTQFDTFHELCFYTMAHPSPSFIHQHAVDAFAAQTAAPGDKPIKLTFALVGLHLHIDRRFSGREVQRAHMMLARTGRSWPSFPLPADRGGVTVNDVLAVPPGSKRDEMISEWCASVWTAFSESHPTVVRLLKDRGVA